MSNIGWHSHTRLNKRIARGNLDMYQLAPLLHKEVQFLQLQVRLVMEKKVGRYQRRTYAKTQEVLATLWEVYAAGSLTTSKIIRRCAHLNGPVV